MKNLHRFTFTALFLGLMLTAGCSGSTGGGTGPGPLSAQPTPSGK